MNATSPFPNGRPQELILRWCDDRLTDEEMVELESLLRQDPALAQVFAELTHVNAALENLGPSLSQSASLSTSARPGSRLIPWPLAQHLLAAAAAILLLGIPAGVLLLPRAGEPPEALTVPPRTLAVVNHILDATWSHGETPLRPGDLIGPSRIRFEAGLVQLQFFNGVQAVIEGPADFEILSAEESFCHQGRFHAIVPPQADSFRVRTNQGELIDFGTEFGLDVKPESAEIHVFDGEVAFQAGADQVPTRLGVGRAAIIASDGSAKPKEANANLFASYREVNQMQAMSTEKRLAEWYQSSLFWRTHPAGIAYFDFEEKDYLSSTFRGETASPYRDPISGLLVGAEVGQGRWPGKAGLSFTRTSDRVRINVPGTHRALTLAAWVRVGNLASRRYGLLMSDGDREGAVHWCLDGATGRLSFETNTASQPEASATPLAFRSGSINRSELLGQWAFLATCYDAERGTAEHYLNGRLIGHALIHLAPSVRIGVADIGNWNSPSSKDHHFEGVIDELMVFSIRLSEDQLEGIAASGRPY